MKNKTTKSDKKSIEERYRCLRNFLLDCNNQEASLKQIKSFYKSNNIDLSEITIKRDLSAINAKCDKKNGNKYYLEDVGKIRRLKSNICKALKKCIIYKPLILSHSINLLEYDDNPSLNYYCITIKSKDLDHEEYFLDKLDTELKKIPDFYDNYDRFNYIEVKQSASSIVFIFDDIDSMKNFYIFINDLRSFND